MHLLRNAALLGGLALLGLPVANAAELIISEYVEGSGNNKALEFYNSGSQVLDLSAYRVEFYFNGASAAGRSIDLSGSLAPGKTFVLANGVADPALLALASQRVEGSWFNGNDAVLLRRRSGEILDSLGQVGFNPGTTWGSGDVQTLDRSLVRKADIRDGDSDPSDAFDPAAQWLGYPRDTFANLGQHGAGEPGGGEEAGLRPIHEVQGAGAESPLVNQRVAIEGVVVGDFQNASELKGFYVQQEDATVDGDPATSEGIFVYDGGNGSDVKLGDRVRVTGQVREFNGLTELVGPLQVSVLASGVALPTPAGISLPLASADALERYEGMRVQLRQTLTVNEVYNLGRYGEVLLSSGGRQMTPTNVVAPGEQAKAMQARNDLDRILLDDGRSGQNPDPIRYPAPELSAYNSLRVGDRTSAIDGVLDYSAGSYRIQPLQTPTFEAANPRPAQPAVEGRLRVASFNVLNYFNGDGKGGGFPTSRGANTAEEFQRQKAKIVAAILASKADIVGLMEIENDGYGEFSAIADLVNGLNASLPQGQRYAFVNPNRAKLGSDEIAVGLIYRGDKVRIYRSAAVLDSSVNPEFDDTRNRPTLAQTFQEINGGERLTCRKATRGWPFCMAHGPGRANNRLRLSAVVVGSRRIIPVALFAPRNGAPFRVAFQCGTWAW